jgi:hypothetical protein
MSHNPVVLSLALVVACGSKDPTTPTPSPSPSPSPSLTPTPPSLPPTDAAQPSAVLDDASSRANVAELEHVRARYSADDPRISRAARAAIYHWFAARAVGVPPLPDHVTDFDGEPITKQEFIATFFTSDEPRNNNFFLKDAWEPLRFDSKHGTVEVVWVSTGEPEPGSCRNLDEECAGFESIAFTVDHGSIVAIRVGAAG